MCNTSCCGTATTWAAAVNVTVGASGLVTGSHVAGCAGGSGTVTAANNAHGSNTSTITVTNDETVSGMAVAPATATIAELGSVQINATASLSNATTTPCNTNCCSTTTTWAAAGNVTVGASGLVTGSHVAGCAGGSGAVTATNNTHPSSASTITVTNDETVSGISIAPTSATIIKLGTVQINATANISDATTASCNSGCCGTTTTWAPTGNVSVSASGLVTGNSIPGCGGGSGTVAALNNGHVSNVSSITVNNDDTLSTLVITPNPGSVSVNGTLQMHAMGNISDGSTSDCTTSCCTHATTWASGNTSILTVNTSGLVTGVTNGTTTCTATNNSISAYAPITVGSRWVSLTTTNEPSGRIYHSAVWSGSEMIIWGGYFVDTEYNPYELNTGGRYNPTTDSWIPTTTTNAPAARDSHSAVWTGTGSRMIIWGGNLGAGDTSDGFSYNPSTNSWSAISMTNAPSARDSHSAVWTGSKMVVFGGYSYSSSTFFNDGGRYDPSGNTWQPISTTNAPDARLWHTAVWTGSKMIIWGGFGSDYNARSTGGVYDPVGNVWSGTTTDNAPEPRFNHTAVWTGSVMIIFGGFDNSNFFNDGFKYNPSSDTWTAISTDNAPSTRDLHTAVWVNSKMVVWGGIDGDSGDDVDTGGMYNPASDTWAELTTDGVPAARDRHTAVAAGTTMIIWGGWDGTNYFSDGGKIVP